MASGVVRESRACDLPFAPSASKRVAASFESSERAMVVNALVSCWSPYLSSVRGRVHATSRWAARS